MNTLHYSWVTRSLPQSFFIRARHLRVRSRPAVGEIRAKRLSVITLPFLEKIRAATDVLEFLGL